MFTVRKSTRHEVEPVKGSRFIVDVGPASDESVARQLLAVAVKDFPDASHHCWAWRIASPAIDRASDDGEPSGSAGRPILAQLTGRDVIDTAVIVTRYFGGTKLGVGGLVRAYGGAAGETLDRSELVPWVAETQINFCHDYAYTDTIERLVNRSGGSLLDRNFETTVHVTVRLPVASVPAFAAQLADLSGGAIVLDLDDADPTDSP